MHCRLTGRTSLKLFCSFSQNYIFKKLGAHFNFVCIEISIILAQICRECSYRYIIWLKNRVGTGGIFFQTSKFNRAKNKPGFHLKCRLKTVRAQRSHLEWDATLRLEYRKMILKISKMLLPGKRCSPEMSLFLSVGDNMMTNYRDKSVFLGNTSLVKFIQNHIWDSGGLFPYPH